LPQDVVLLRAQHLLPLLWQSTSVRVSAVRFAAHPQPHVGGGSTQQRSEGWSQQRTSSGVDLSILASLAMHLTGERRVSLRARIGRRERQAAALIGASATASLMDVCTILPPDLMI
jgi:hypothetical protein